MDVTYIALSEYVYIPLSLSLSYLFSIICRVSCTLSHAVLVRPTTYILRSFSLYTSSPFLQLPTVSLSPAVLRSDQYLCHYSPLHPLTWPYAHLQSTLSLCRYKPFQPQNPAVAPNAQYCLWSCCFCITSPT